MAIMRIMSIVYKFNFAMNYGLGRSLASGSLSRSTADVICMLLVFAYSTNNEYSSLVVIGGMLNTDSKASRSY